MMIRSAVPHDGPVLGRMGAALARLHHEWDPQRFILPEGIEEGYRTWLVKEAKNPRAVVLVAESAGEAVGYAYGGLEGRDWNLLRDACGAFHDLWIEPSARRQGLGAKLAEEMMRRLTAMGAPRVVLSVAAKNGDSQRLFARLGWRATMVEMAREAAPDAPLSRDRTVASAP